MEFPRRDPDLEDRAGSRLGQYRRLQAGDAHAAHRRAHRGNLRRVRTAGWRSEPGVRRRTGGRRHDRASPGDPRGVVHRIERRRRRPVRCRGCAWNQVPMRDGRQEPHRSARRRRSRSRGGKHRPGSVWVDGTALHRDQPCGGGRSDRGASSSSASRRERRRWWWETG